MGSATDFSHSQDECLVTWLKGWDEEMERYLTILSCVKLNQVGLWRASIGLSPSHKQTETPDLWIQTKLKHETDSELLRLSKMRCLGE